MEGATGERRRQHLKRQIENSVGEWQQKLPKGFSEEVADANEGLMRCGQEDRHSWMLGQRTNVDNQTCVCGIREDDACSVPHEDVERFRIHGAAH